MHTEPQHEHRWLQKFLGEWTYEHACAEGTDGAAEKFRGTERVRSIGGLWILGEGKGPMPGGGEATMLFTLGYDPKRRKYVGTWVGSMMAHLWVYEGELDAAGRVLPLNTTGPKFSPEGQPVEGTAQYRDVHEFKSDDHRTLTSFLRGDDGEWRQFMQAHYHRVA